jgi:site-specific DNA-cytosine methylase
MKRRSVENRDILSLFDGMGCAYESLERAGIEFNNYYASEINKSAIKVAQKNHPGIIQLGDINEIEFKKYKGIWMIMGGSPCQGFSFAGKQLNFDDPRSKLFFKFAEAVSIIKPKYFLLENVNMKQEYQDIISKYLGVKPIKINSALVSAQNRVRLYWTNIPFIGMPKNRNILLKNILESDDGLTVNYSSSGRGKGKIEGRISEAIKALTLTRTGYTKRSITGVAIYHTPHGFNHGGIFKRLKHPTLRIKAQNNYFYINHKKYRKLTCTEWERLQTLPDGYTQCDSVSNSQRYKMIGNGWNIETIVHILTGLKK